MRDLSSLFDISTGLYSVYKWSCRNGIPKELFILIFTYYRNCDRCIFCSIKCCRYNNYQKHRNNNISLCNLVTPLINAHNDYSFGKIICIAFTKNESTQIPFTIKLLLDNLLGLIRHFKVNDQTYRMNVIDFSYDIIFSLIGHIFSSISIKA